MRRPRPIIGYLIQFHHLSTMCPRRNAEISLSKRSSHSLSSHHMNSPHVGKFHRSNSTQPSTPSYSAAPSVPDLPSLRVSCRVASALCCDWMPNLTLFYYRLWEPSLLPYLTCTTTITHYEAYIIMTDMPPWNNTENSMLSPLGETILRKPKKLIVCCDGQSANACKSGNH